VKIFWTLLIITLSMATAAIAAEEGGPAVRQGGQIGELRTFIANGLTSGGKTMFTTPSVGWFTVTEICANTADEDERQFEVHVFAGQLHVTTLTAEEGGIGQLPKCIQFPSGMVLPRNTVVTCKGGGQHECWITGICSRDCNLPASN
jgi:hypothetical protein